MSYNKSNMFLIANNSFNKNDLQQMSQINFINCCDFAFRDDILLQTFLFVHLYKRAIYLASFLSLDSVTIFHVNCGNVIS